MAGILAAASAPALCKTGWLMPLRSPAWFTLCDEHHYRQFLEPGAPSPGIDFGRPGSDLGTITHAWINGSVIELVLPTRLHIPA